MKTTLKDLIEKLQKFRLIKEDENSYELFRQLEYEAVEKEKEQIQEWYAKGWGEATKIGIEEAHKYQDLLNEKK